MRWPAVATMVGHQVVVAAKLIGPRTVVPCWVTTSMIEHGPRGLTSWFCNVGAPTTAPPGPMTAARTASTACASVTGRLDDLGDGPHPRDEKQPLQWRGAGPMDLVVDQIRARNIVGAFCSGAASISSVRSIRRALPDARFRVGPARIQSAHRTARTNESRVGEAT